MRAPSRKKALKFKTVNSFQNKRVLFVFTFLSVQSNRMFSHVLISQAFVLFFPFSKWQYISCCPWSEVCMILAFLSHPISLFLVICFDLPVNRTFFDFPWRLDIGSRLYSFLPRSVPPSFNNWIALDILSVRKAQKQEYQRVRRFPPKYIETPFRQSRALL